MGRSWFGGMLRERIGNILGLSFDEERLVRIFWGLSLLMRFVRWFMVINVYIQMRREDLKGAVWKYLVFIY